MQIALDTVIYILLSLMLFSLVMSFLPKVEQLSYVYAKEDLRVDKEEAIDIIIDVYLSKREEETLILKDRMTKEYLEQKLEEAGLNNGDFEINFNTATAISIVKEDGRVIING